MKCVWILLTVFWGITVSAQPPESLLNPKNTALVGTQTVQTFDGKPAVLIEPTPGISVRPTNPADSLPAPTLAPAKPLAVTTPFGHNGTAAYTDQITDRVVWVRILNPDTVHITEQVQLITTDGREIWDRSFIPGESDIEILSLTHNGRRENFDLYATPQSLKIQSKTPLGKGIHNIVLDYIVRGGLISDSSMAELKWPLTESDPTRMTERMTVIVQMPKESAFYTKELLFGGNRVAVSDQYRVRPDIKGNLIFQMNRPLPAKADVWLHLMFDAQIFGPNDRDMSPGIQIGLILGGVWLLYVLVCIAECRLKRYRQPLRIARRISPVLTAAFLGIPLRSDRFLSGIRWAGLTRFPIVLTILAFFRFCGEYIIGITLLNLGVRLTARYWHFELSAGLIALVGCLSLLGLFLIYYFGVRFRVRYLCRRIYEALTTTPEGITPAPHSIPLYETWTGVLGFDREWYALLIANNPSLKTRLGEK